MCNNCSNSHKFDRQPALHYVGFCDCCISHKWQHRLKSDAESWQPPPPRHRNEMKPRADLMMRTTATTTMIAVTLIAKRSSAAAFLGSRGSPPRPLHHSSQGAQATLIPLYPSKQEKHPYILPRITASQQVL